MIDEVYKNAFKEVWEILQNTDESLLNKVPNKFLEFIKSNMNNNFETSIRTDIDIDKQPLLKETEAILSLIYRSYWASDEEKIAFANRDKQELYAIGQNRKLKNVNELFKNKRNLNNITIDNNLMVIKKESFFIKIFNKIKRAFRHF